MEQIKTYDASVSRRILFKLGVLKSQPTHFAKPLTGIDLWSLRVGDYRVLFDLYQEEKLIYIVKIGHRDDFYKDLN